MRSTVFSVLTEVSNNCNYIINILKLYLCSQKKCNGLIFIFLNKIKIKEFGDFLLEELILLNNRLILLGLTLKLCFQVGSTGQTPASD